MEIVSQKIASVQEKPRSQTPAEFFKIIRLHIAEMISFLKAFGITDQLDDYEKRKLTLFIRINFFQLITGFLIPLLGLLHSDQLPDHAWHVAGLPACVSIVVLGMIFYHRYQAALLIYFLFYPLFTYIVYLQGIDAGTELNFILFGVLSVFFLRDTGYMAFTVAFSMMSYFMTAVVLKTFTYQVEAEYKSLFLINQFLSLVYIFYGLFLIKKENNGYLLCILSKNKDLHQKTEEIQKQKEEIAEKAALLESQKTGLAELNVSKNKLFSIIAHDLKSPIYALRQLFHNIEHYNVPAEDVKKMVPDVIKDLNYTTGLMENVLQWAKSQMQAITVHPQDVDVNQSIAEVAQLLHLQAEAKQVYIRSSAEEPVYVHADKDMVHLVLRNLLSNAIKFTPKGGSILVGVNEMQKFVEVFVQDSGTGISKEALKKIKQNNFYTTKGTSSESGTGLGLMLCKEFLAKIGGQMHIESEEGKGSTFSFTLPRSECLS